jgi:hypothetical protein
VGAVGASVDGDAIVVGESTTTAGVRSSGATSFVAGFTEGVEAEGIGMVARGLEASLLNGRIRWTISATPASIDNPMTSCAHALD